MTTRTKLVAAAAIVTAAILATAVVIALNWLGDGPRLPGVPAGSERLAPEGAPFSYDMPEGWVRAVSRGEPTYMTSVGPPLGSGNTAVVAVALLSDNPDDIANQVYQSMQQVTQAGAKPPAGLEVSQVTLAGHPATRYVMDSDPGGLYEFVELPDGRVLYLLCQWLSHEHRADADYGCDSLRASLTIGG